MGNNTPRNNDYTGLPDFAVIQRQKEEIKHLSEWLQELSRILQGVATMRDKQKEYFKSGSSKIILRESKTLEMRVDTDLATLVRKNVITGKIVDKGADQGTLFG